MDDDQPQFRFELTLPYLKEQPLTFESAEALHLWASQQLAAFEVIASNAGSYSDLWQRHVNFFKAIVTTLEEIPEDTPVTTSMRDAILRGVKRDLPAEIRRFLGSLQAGELITTLHPSFQIAEFFSNKGDHLHARTVLLLAIKEGLDKRVSSDLFRDIESLFRALMSLHSQSLSSDRPVDRWNSDLADVHQRSTEKMVAFTLLLTQAKRDLQTFEGDQQALKSSQEAMWGTHMKDTREQWDLMRAVYDEQLALAAPAVYWTERNVSHTKAAKIYASVFVGAVVVSLGAFIWKGIPYLSSIPVEASRSALVSVLPVLIPLFGVVWMLRILARQLSENMTLMQDAKERVTMVKTFLALMKDETTGKSVVTDQDRVLILHSLFRPSTVTATDDSPPLSVLERLAPKSK